MDKLNRLLPKNRFARAVSVLAGGTAGAQLIVIAISPILTRLYTPDDFGLFAVFAAVLGILSVIASLRYELAIPLPESDEKAVNVAALSFFVLIGLTILLSIFLWGFGNSFVLLLNTQGLQPYLWLLPVGLAFVGVYQILQYWSLRAKDFGLIAKTKMAQSTSVAGLQIIGASIGPFALLAGRVIGQIIVDVMLLKGSSLYSALVKAKINLRNIIFVAKKYRQFPLFSSWAGLLNATGAQVPPLFFAASFGPAAAGGYMLAQRIINMPLSLIGSAVSDAFLPSSIDARRENRLGNQVAKLYSALASFIFPGTVVLFFIAPDFFQIIFGNDWLIAGEIVRWLAPMLAIQFLINPVSRVFVTLERQGLALALQASLFGFRISALFMAHILELSLLSTVQLFSIGSFVGYFLYFIVISKILSISFDSLWRGGKATILCSASAYTFCFLVYEMLDNFSLKLFISILGGGIILSINLFVSSKNNGFIK